MFGYIDVQWRQQRPPDMSDSSWNALYKRRHNSDVKYMKPIQPTLVTLKTYTASGSNLRSDKNIIFFFNICSTFNEPCP
jgi:hypothetical protein